MPSYRKAFFDPAGLPGFAKVGNPDGSDRQREDWAYDAGAAFDGSERHFVFAEEAVLALNIALATGRPLLVSGEPGGGKTSLARFAAHALGSVFYRETITSRTQASDLLSSFDALQRLSDAQVKDGLRPKQAYVVPGGLWWALNPETAAQRGHAPLAGETLLADPGIAATTSRPASAAEPIASATLLLDEIDKADPDVPNDLLESLDERRFVVRETGERVIPSRSDLLIVLTTNGERELPPAFMRRCVTVELPKPDENGLLAIARRRFGPDPGPFGESLYRELAEHVVRLRKPAPGRPERPPSTSEYIDAVAACRRLLAENWLADGKALDALLGAVLTKQVRFDAGAGTE